MSRLVEGVRPDNPAMALRLPDFDFGAAGTMARMDGEIVRQALMVSYIDSFWLLFIACLVAAPLVLFCGVRNLVWTWLRNIACLAIVRWREYRTLRPPLPRAA